MKSQDYNCIMHLCLFVCSPYVKQNKQTNRKTIIKNRQPQKTISSNSTFIYGSSRLLGIASPLIYGFLSCSQQWQAAKKDSRSVSRLTICWSLFSPNLSWRDVQHLVVETAQVTSPVDEGWMKNGAGYHFNHKFGFGRLDAAAMVRRAKTWKNAPPQRTCHGPSSQTQQ